jgi:hypothetical protein
MKRVAFALAVVAASIAVAGCSVGQADSFSDIGLTGATVHGRIASDQDFAEVISIVLVAPAPKVPRLSTFDPDTDQGLPQCGTLEATSDPNVDTITAPIGSSIIGSTDLDCTQGRQGVATLQPDTEYNVRICAHDSTMPLSDADKAYNCGGVRSFTTNGLS